MKNYCELSEFDITKVDFHSHILPKIDDGARSVEESMRIIDSASKCGIEVIVATPHFYAHKISLDEFCKKREKAYKALKEKKPQIPIVLGAEILVFPGLENLEGIEKLAIGEEKILLLEMPLASSLIYEDYFLTVEELSKRFKIVMAHANRYSDMTVINMIEAGALLQVNFEDVCNGGEKKRIKQWLCEDLVFALGSDAHQTATSYGKYKKAMRFIEKTRKHINRD